jgi:hypothetical protein
MIKQEILVIPKKKMLDGKGCVWEYLLAATGYNDLPDDKKIGKVTEMWKIEGDAVVCTVEWPGANHTSKDVFPDELEVISVSK